MSEIDLWIVLAVKFVVLAFLFLFGAIVVDLGVGKLLRILGVWDVFLKLLSQKYRKGGGQL